jgi:hypothetical protein
MGSTLNVTGASTLASLGVTGAATVGTTLGVTGLSTLASLAVTGASTLDSLAVTNAATLGSVAVTAGATVGTSLAVTGDLTANGNTTLGNQNTDTLALNSDNITVPNLSPVTVDLANDNVLITDASNSGKVKLVTAIQFAPQVAQTLYQGSTAGASPYTAISTGSGVEITDLTTSITPRSTSSKILVTIAINYTATAPNYGAFRITRNGVEIGSNSVGSNLFGIASLFGFNSYSGNALSSLFIQILDSPSTASSAVYKLHLYTTGSGGIFPQIWLNKTQQDISSGSNSAFDARTSSSMILQEYLA